MTSSPIGPKGRKTSGVLLKRLKSKELSPSLAPAGSAAQLSPSAQRQGSGPHGLSLDAGALNVVAEACGAGLNERVVLRAYVERRLVEVFGPQLVVAPRFQDIVSETVDALFAEPALQNIMQTVYRQLTAPTAGD